MSYLASHWTFDPILLAVGFVVCLHELGLANLRRRSSPVRSRARRRRSFLFYGGLALLVVVVVSPLDYFASEYFFVHMIEHILIMFYASLLVVAGAPWLPMVHGLPVGARRRVLRSLLLGRWSAPLRALCRVLVAPWTAVLVFCSVMVLWHVPGLFDAAETNQAIHVWLMHGSMFVAGILFWLQIIPSYPIRPKLGPVGQVGAILGSNVVMFFLAMSLSIFTTSSWYNVYSHVPGVTLSPYADQQIGAAILWVCGDFWALPALIMIFRSIRADGSLSTLVDRALHHDVTPTAEQLEAMTRSSLSGR